MHWGSIKILLTIGKCGCSLIATERYGFPLLVKLLGISFAFFLEPQSSNGYPIVEAIEFRLPIFDLAVGYQFCFFF
jgi:hypothetical protein